jgi:hypothetical protein
LKKEKRESNMIYTESLFKYLKNINDVNSERFFKILLKINYFEENTNFHFVEMKKELINYVNKNIESMSLKKEETEVIENYLKNNQVEEKNIEETYKILIMIKSRVEKNLEGTILKFVNR